MPVFEKNKIMDALKRFFVGHKDGSDPVVLSKMAFIVYGLLIMFFIGIAYPVQENLFRSFFASITQDLVIAEVNPSREELKNIGPLRPHPKLAQAAQMKAEDMIARDYFSHNSPEGERPWVWLNRVGYKYALAGENLAIDFNDPELLVRAWLNSPSHARNILNEYYTDIGIGVAEGEYQGRKTTAVVMFLGKEISPTLESLAPELKDESVSEEPQPAEEEIVNIAGLKDGDLIKTADSQDVYIVKIQSGKYFKRLILNPNIFDSYNHLSWNNIKTVDKSVIEKFSETQMVMEVYPDGSPVDGRVYVLTSAEGADNGTKHHLSLNENDFEELGYDWDAIYKINQEEASELFYPEGIAINKETLPTFAFDPKFKTLLTDNARFAAVAGAETEPGIMDTVQLFKEDILKKEAGIVAAVFSSDSLDAVREPSKFWIDIKTFLLSSFPRFTRLGLAAFFSGLLVWLLVIVVAHGRSILFFAPRAFILAFFAGLLLL